MRDIAGIAAELRKVLPVEHWKLVDRLVDIHIDILTEQYMEAMKSIRKDFDHEKRTEAI